MTRLKRVGMIRDWKLDELDEQCQEIDTDNEGKVKTENDIQDGTNSLVTEGEEMGEGNLLKVETEENEPKESIKQKVLKDISVKTTSKILSSFHKGTLTGNKNSHSSLQVIEKGTTSIF